MAKRVETTTPLKKGASQFVLVGKAVINDFTFTIDKESASKYMYSSLKMGVDCGETGTMFAEMMGGYSNAKGAKNVVYVHGKKKNDAGKMIDDYDARWELDWDDRLDEEMHEEIGDSCFITVGIEKKADGKTFYKKFLNAYDAVEYVKEHLEAETVVRVQGKLTYSVYDGFTQAKKEITSIALSNATEDKFGATFSQAILVDKDSVSKLDKEKNSYLVTANVVEYIGKVTIDGKKIEIKKSATLPRNFEVLHLDDEKTPKLLKMVFGAKSNAVWEVVVEGYITKGVATVQATFDDLPDDIKELVEYGAMTEEEALTKCIGRGSKTETFVIKAPRIKRVEKDGVATNAVDINKAKYTVADYVFYDTLLENAGVKVEVEADEDEEDEEEIDIDALLDEME